MKGKVKIMNQNKNLTVKIDRLVSKKDSSVKAYASATIANSFAIHGIKVIDSSKGLFVQMPQSSYKQKDGQVQYNDIFHAITADARAELIDSVKNTYEERLHMEEEQSQGEEIEDGLTQTM